MSSDALEISSLSAPSSGTVLDTIFEISEDVEGVEASVLLILSAIAEKLNIDQKRKHIVYMLWLLTQFDDCNNKSSK